MNQLYHNLKIRSALLRALRNAFYKEDFLEVATAVKIPAPAPEEYIESVQCADGEFLRTSPELAMKRMLCAGMEKIFQFGSAFRAEESGRKHREEFTILEYYSVNWDYRQLAEFTAGMIASAAEELYGKCRIIYQGHPVDMGRHTFITVDEAFRKYAGVSAFEADADMTLADIFEKMELEPDFAEEEEGFEHKRASEWAFEHFTHIPAVDETFTYQNLTVTVSEMKSNRIRRIRIDVAEPVSAEGGAEE